MTTPKLKPFELRHIGEMVQPYGKIAAVGNIGGERYYWMVSYGGAVSMMPAVVVEQIWQSQGKNRRLKAELRYPVKGKEKP